MEAIQLDRRARIFFYVFFGIIGLSMLTMYVRYMVLEDYDILLTPEAEEYLGSLNGSPPPSP